MKKVSLFFGGLFVFLLLIACEDFPSISPAFTFSKEFYVNNSGVSFSGQDVVDANSASGFDKYLDKVTKVKIKKITYTITEVGGSATKLNSGTLAVANSDGSGKTNLVTLSNIDFASALNNETEISAESAGITLVENALATSPNKLNIYYSGTANQAPIKLRVKVSFYTKITVKLLGS